MEIQPDYGQRICNTLFTSESLQRDQLLLSEFTLIFYHHLFNILAPIQKLITSERLSYLPNLYYQLYRSIQKLSLLRSHFPEQKVLVERPKTKHDCLLEQMKRKQFTSQENIKYKKVMAYQLAKAAKEEVLKKNLKKEEKYLFHRVVYSHLAEASISKIQNQAATNVEPVQPEKAQEIQKKPAHHHHQANDIFMDRSQSQEEPLIEHDLLDDILNQNQPNHYEQVKQPEIQNISHYIKELVNLYGASVHREQKYINRKQCMEKINEDLRKRIKNKTSDDSQERNLNSATVLITNLIRQENETKMNDELFQVASFNEYLTTVQGKSKRKKQEIFELKWGEENMGKFLEMNPKFEPSKTKFGPNFLLTSLQKKEYENYFDKNIQSKVTFPPTLRSIPDISQKFRQKYYYNSIVDPEYEKFVIRHNKQRVFQKFKETSKYVLDNSYQHDIQSNSSINMAKMFLTSEGPMNDRVIYKINPNRTISAVPLPVQSLLTRAELSELSFLVRKYLGVFGSNWKLISLFVAIHPTFSNMFLSAQQIQQLSQITKHKNNDESLQSNDNFLQKSLPFSVYSAQVSKPYCKLDKNTNFQVIDEEPIQEKSQQTQLQNTDTLKLDNYENLINQPLITHDQKQQYAFSATTKEYEKFCEDIRFPSGIDFNERIKDAFVDSVTSVISQFQNSSPSVTLSAADHKEPNVKHWIFQNITEKLKGEIRVGQPARKRKNINQKTSELVKILHTLKQKIANPAQQGQQRAPPPPSIASGSTSKQNPTGTPAGTETSQTKRLLPKKQKPEDKQGTQKQIKEKEIKEKEKKEAPKSGVSKSTTKRKKKDKQEDK